MAVSLEILFVGIVTFFLITLTIRASKMRIKDAVFWVAWTIVLAVFSLVPETTIWIKNLMKISSPELFLFGLLVTFSYFMMLRTATTISMHEDKIKELTQVIAIQQLEQKKINKQFEERLKQLGD